MQSKAETADAYVLEYSLEEQIILNKLRTAIKEVLPLGYEEQMQWGMIVYCVPLDRYPIGYLEDGITALPYISLAKQKHHYAFYSIASYGAKELFQKEKERYETKYGKLDQGAACIRFRSEKKIDYELVKNLSQAMSVNEFIQFYERSRQKV